MGFVALFKKIILIIGNFETGFGPRVQYVVGNIKMFCHNNGLFDSYLGYCETAIRTRLQCWSKKSMG